MFNFDYDIKNCCFLKPEKGILDDQTYSAYLIHYSIATTKLEEIKKEKDIIGKNFSYHYWDKSVKES